MNQAESRSGPLDPHLGQHFVALACICLQLRPALLKFLVQVRDFKENGVELSSPASLRPVLPMSARATDSKL
jgi:hypothetical protein